MDRYAVIGNPVAHSRSPQIHAAFASQTGQELVYTTLFAPRDGFAAAVAEFRASGGRGLNVTVPFKQEAFALADESSERARSAGAVNTLTFRDARMLGDNTDGIGLVRDLMGNLGVTIKGGRVLLIGAGGAARGVIRPLLGERPARLTIVNRTAAKAVELAQSLSIPDVVEGFGFEELSGRRYDVVVNATSTGLSGAALALSDDLFSAGALAYDMMYGRGLTPFLRQAAAAGARTADGLGMLVEQAAESFFIWRGVRPDTRPVLEALRAGLQTTGA